MDHKPVLLKQTANKQELTNWENILITKNKDCDINFEIPPADHLTKKFILNPVEGSRSAPTRISNQNQSVMGRQWGQCPWKRFLHIQVSDVLCYKLILIIYRTSLLQNSQKVIRRIAVKFVKLLDSFIFLLILFYETSLLFIVRASLSFYSYFHICTWYFLFSHGLFQYNTSQTFLWLI